jgi:hypothetical protein
MFEQLSQLELLVLAAKLRTAKRQALRAALHSRSPHEIWDMIGLGRHLSDLGGDVDWALAYYWGR